MAKGRERVFRIQTKSSSLRSVAVAIFVVILFTQLVFLCYYRHVDHEPNSHSFRIRDPNKSSRRDDPSDFVKRLRKENGREKSKNEERIKDIACQTRPGEDFEGPWGYQMLYSSSFEKSSVGERGLPRILCLVISSNQQEETNLLRSIASTYAPQCDGYLAAANVTDHKSNALDVIRYFRSQSERTYWNRLRFALRYIKENILSEYDFVFVATDRTYAHPDNLRHHLSSNRLPLFPGLKAINSENVQEIPLYIGTGTISSESFDDFHCGAGAGFVLNRPAISAFISKLWGCLPPLGQQIEGDMQLARCFRQIGMKCTHMRDEKQATIFQQHSAQYMGRWTGDIKGPPVFGNILKENHDITIKGGKSGWSTQSASFYLADSTSPVHDMLRTHAIVRGLCHDTWYNDDSIHGALDSDGKPGYVHDAAYLRHHPIPMSFHFHSDNVSVCGPKFGTGPEGANGYKGLQKIRIMDDKSRDNLKKIMCVVYTHSGAHQDRIQAIAETYAPRCDGFLAASNQTDVKIGAANILHEGPEAYSNMWQKVRAIWRYVYEHYIDDYDFFILGGDDYYVVPENLRYLVSKNSWNHSAPLYLGGSIGVTPSKRFCGGGSGYTLNKVAVRLFVEVLQKHPSCWPHWEASEEDVIMSSCFRRADIQCMDTNDDEGEARYHAMDAETHASWDRSKPSIWRAEILVLDRHKIRSRQRLGQISNSSVSFHIKDHYRRGSMYKDNGMRRYHAILYGLCKDAANDG